MPASSPRRVAGLPDCLGPCLAALALLVAAAVLLSAPTPVRAAAPFHACAGSGTSATLSALLKAAQAPAAVVRDDTSVEAADVEAPAEFGLPALHRAAVRMRRAAVIAYADRSNPPPSPSRIGSPHRPPRAA